MSSHIIVRSWFESHGSWWSWYIMSLLAMQIGSGLSWHGGRQGAAALWYNIMKLRLDSVIQDSFLMFFVYRFSSVSHLFFFAGSTAPLLHCSTVPFHLRDRGPNDISATSKASERSASAAGCRTWRGWHIRNQKIRKSNPNNWKALKSEKILMYIVLYWSILLYIASAI